MEEGLHMCKGHQSYMLHILKCAPREPPAKNVQTSSFKTCLHYPRGEGKNKLKAEMGKKRHCQHKIMYINQHNILWIIAIIFMCRTK